MKGFLGKLLPRRRQLDRLEQLRPPTPKPAPKPAELYGDKETPGTGLNARPRGYRKRRRAAMRARRANVDRQLRERGKK